MKGVIFITADTLRADHVSCYGSDTVQTPNLDRLADKGALFESNYAASYPTVPNRLDLWTGKFNFPHRGWTSLRPGETTLPDLLTKSGVVSELVYDTPFLGTYNFDRGFSGWDRIRGHHADRDITDPTISTSLPAQPYKLKQLSKTRQYLRNSSDWRYERDFIAPRTFQRAIDWLERNRHHEQFFLMIDAWDPHEIFDAPDHYIDMYDQTKADEAVIYPVYGRPEYMSDTELEHVRARYAAKVTMVDAWVGKLLDHIERLGLADEVAVIFTSDHGHLFGEHDLQGKPTGSLGKLYLESVWTPLLVRHPDGLAVGERYDALTQPPDLTATVIDLLDVPVPESTEGTSLLTLLRGDAETIREYAIAARYPEGPEAEAAVFDGWAGPENVVSPVTICDGQWYLVCHPDRQQSELYDLSEDPRQEQNVIEDEPDVAAKLRDVYVDFMRDHDADDRMLEPFTDGPTTTDTLADDRTVYSFSADGRVYAHLDADVANRRRPEHVAPDDVTQTTFGALAGRDADALVYINQQYYRPEDLAK